MRADGDVGELECVNKLETMLNSLAESSPEATKFLHHVFEHVATPSNPAAKSQDSYSDALRNGAGEIPSEAPDSFHDILHGSKLHAACVTEINNRARGASYYHYNSYYDIGRDIADMIVDGATRAVLQQFLSTGAYGRFTPSTNTARDVDEFVDEMSEIVLTVKKRFKNGWAVKGRDEASYFGKGLDPEKYPLPVQRLDENRKEKQDQACAAHTQRRHTCVAHPPPTNPSASWTCRRSSLPQMARPRYSQPPQLQPS